MLDTLKSLLLSSDFPSHHIFSKTISDVFRYWLKLCLIFTTLNVFLFVALSVYSIPQIAPSLKKILPEHIQLSKGVLSTTPSLPIDTTLSEFKISINSDRFTVTDPNGVSATQTYPTNLDIDLQSHQIVSWVATHQVHLILAISALILVISLLQLTISLVLQLTFVHINILIVWVVSKVRPVKFFYPDLLKISMYALIPGLVVSFLIPGSLSILVTVILYYYYSLRWTRSSKPSTL
jgi:hypothetical protein